MFIVIFAGIGLLLGMVILAVLSIVDELFGGKEYSKPFEDFIKDLDDDKLD